MGPPFLAKPLVFFFGEIVDQIAAQSAPKKPHLRIAGY
jgi:hypothetical protein